VKGQRIVFYNKCRITMDHDMNGARNLLLLLKKAFRRRDELKHLPSLKTIFSRKTCCEKMVTELCRQVIKIIDVLTKTIAFFY